jgi:hypothetical protein
VSSYAESIDTAVRRAAIGSSSASASRRTVVLVDGPLGRERVGERVEFGARR